MVEYDDGDDDENDTEDIPGTAGGWPEEIYTGCWPPTNVYQRWFYAYMTPLLAKGSRQKRDKTRLAQEDLFPVPSSMDSAYLVREFR